MPTNAKHEQAIKAAIPLIKEKEGFEAKAYKDQVGVVTIGYGFTSAVIPGLKMGDTITREKADKLLEAELRKKYAAPVANAIKVWDDPGFTPNMATALYSLAWNVGPGVAKHDIIKAINAKNWKKAAELFDQPAYKKAGGKINKGLATRRAAELQIFTTGMAVKAGIGLGTLLLLGGVGYLLWKKSKGSGGGMKPAYA